MYCWKLNVIGKTWTSSVKSRGPVKLKNIRNFFARFSFFFCKIVTFPSETTFFHRDLPKMFQCDKLLSSKRALNDHKRKKHNCQENVSAKIFKCGHCEVSFTKSCNLLRHLRSQHESGSSYRCFSCPTYFGELKSLTDHQEQYHNDISSSTAKVDFSDLLDFTTEAVNSKFRIHRLKLDDNSVLEPFNYLILVREKLYLLWTRYWEKLRIWNLGWASLSGWKSLWKVKPLRLSSIRQCVELPVSSLKTNRCNTLTHWWHNWMCSPLVVQAGSSKQWNSWR